MKRKRSVQGVVMSRFIVCTIGIWLARVFLEFIVSFTSRDVNAFGTTLTFAELAFTPPDERAEMQNPYLVETVAASLIWIAVSWAVYYAGIRLFGQSIRRKIAKPVQLMEAGFSEVATGNLDVTLEFETETEFREMRDAFNTMARRLKESEEQRLLMENERMNLFSHIAHDLKTPITAITGYAGALASGMAEDAGKTREYHLAIQAQSSQLNRLTEQLLAYSKMGASGYRLNQERVDAAELLRVTCASLFGEMERKHMELQMCLPEKPVFIAADQLELNRAVGNLLANAIRHNPDGILLSVGLTEEPDGVSIEIADSGPAIPEAIAGKLFEPFVSGSSARSSGSGTGLGLAIVKKSIEQHGGKVFLSDAAAPYTKAFVIRLPKQPIPSKESVV